MITMPNKWRLNAGMLVALAIILGRLLGLTRDVLLARAFGKSDIADWATLLLSLPDLVVNLLVGGAVAAVLIPEWTRRNSLDRSRLYRQSLITFALVFGLISVALWFFRHLLYAMLAPGLSMSLESQGSGAFALILVAIPLTSLAGVTTAYANFNGSYFLPALGTCVLNVAVIAGLLLGATAKEPLLFLGGGIMLGALVRWGMQLMSAHTAASVSVISQVSSVETSPSAARPLLVQYANALIASSLLLLLPVVARSFASSVGSGYLALFNYAQKLADLPTGVIVTAVATILLPHLSRHLVRESDRPAARQAFYLSIRFSIAASVAMIIPAIAFARPIVALLFGGRALGGAELDVIANLMCIGFVGFPFQATIAILMLSFSSQKDNLTPLIACLFGVIILPMTAALLLQHLGILGISAALVLSQAIIAAILAIALNRKASLNLLGAFSDAVFLRAIMLGGGALLMLCFIGREFAGTPIFVQVIFAILSGGAALLFMLRVDTSYRSTFSGLKGTKA